MDERPDLQIPRASYAVQMILATGVGLFCALSVARAMGDAGGVRAALIALAAGSLVTFLPVLAAVHRSHWGLVVVGSGVVRGLLVLGIAYALTKELVPPGRRAGMMGAASGTVLILMIEAVVAVVILSRIERTKSSLIHPGMGSSSPKPVEQP